MKMIYLYISTHVIKCYCLITISKHMIEQENLIFFPSAYNWIRS